MENCTAGAYFTPGLTESLGAAHHSVLLRRLGLIGAIGIGHGHDGIDRLTTAEARGSRAVPRMGLSGKLLVLTILFVMIAEVLIYVPSIANFRLNWLQDRLSSAYTAALVLEATPELVPGDADAADPRQHRRAGGRHEDRQAAPAARRHRYAAAVDHEIDMRKMSWARATIDAFDTLFSPTTK